FATYKIRRRLQQQSTASRLDAEQQAMQVEHFEAALYAAQQSTTDLQASKDALLQQLARAEQASQSLNQRLDELRLELQERAEEIKHVRSHELQLEKKLASLNASHAERLAAYEQLQKNIEQSG